eukprot:6492176-Amphidinium_carterae.2
MFCTATGVSMTYKRLHVCLSDGATMRITVKDLLRQFGGCTLCGSRCMDRGGATVVLNKFASDERVPPLLCRHPPLLVQVLVMPQFVHTLLSDVGGEQRRKHRLEALQLPRQHCTKLTLCQYPELLHREHALRPVQPVKHLCHELVTTTDFLCTCHCLQQSAKSVELCASNIPVRRLV